MKNESNVDKGCVHVFAGAMASVSHEIKNTLSIINENAGLLVDLVGMAGQDGEIPAERVQASASLIMKQVTRSNKIMKNLNLFAHSADTSLAQVNVAEILSLVVALVSRRAAMRKISVAVNCSPDLMIHTYLLPFESLLYLTLCRIYECTASGSSIAIEAEADSPNFIIRFVVKGETTIVKEECSDDERVLAEHVGGACLYEENTLMIVFPADINTAK